MSLLGNILWILFGGFIGGLAWAGIGLVLCLTIVGMPLGYQCLKIAGLIFWPFGKRVDLGNFGAGGLLLNLIWLLVVGWELAVFHVITGFLLCLTLVGIPFGLQHFKFAQLSLMPFGAQVLRN